MKTFDINNIQLKIQSPDVHVNEELNTYILGQIEKLGKTFSRIERCEMMLKAEKNSKNQNCQIEGKLFVPGQVLFASSKSDHFRMAAKMMFEDLHDQLYSFKEKMTDKTI